jgi:predicted ATPase
VSWAWAGGVPLIALRGERSLSQFVGRTRELATLEALLTRVEAGEGQVVGVVGEAGTGKSRQRLSESMAQTILAKAEGNPFFLEELTRTVLDVGESQAALIAPDTVQGVLMARIDRLPEVAKRLLQTASVLGRAFSLRLLSAIWAEPGGLAPLLLELKRFEFVYEQTGAEEPTYVFKHALTQDVAYESLLMSRPGRRRHGRHASRRRPCPVYGTAGSSLCRTDGAPRPRVWHNASSEEQ